MPISAVVKESLFRAFSFGQTYWSQADSEYASQWAKSDATRDKFHQLVDETLIAIQPPIRVWTSLTLADKQAILDDNYGGSRADIMDKVEAILKERNHVTSL